MIRFRNFILLLLMSSFMVSCNENATEESKSVDKKEVQQKQNGNKNKKNRKKKEPAKLIAPESKVVNESYPDTYPLYPGCKEEAYEARKRCAQQKMIENVIKVMKYPQSAIDDDVEGVVVHTFIIEADGTMSDLRLSKSLTPECDMAARQAIEDLMKLSGPWEPGTLKGENQPVRYTLPLSFTNTKKK